MWNKTLAEIQETVNLQFLEANPTSSVLNRFSFDWTLAHVLSAIVWILYRYLDYIARQQFITLADIEHLKLKGSERGIEYNYATFAQGYVNITGTEAYEVPENTLLLRNGDSLVYKVLSNTVLTDEATPVEIRCSVAGTIGNVETGTIFVTQEPNADVDEIVNLTPFSATDDENVETYRERVLSDVRNEPQGGSATDYESWALSQPYVTKCRVKSPTLGYITVLFLTEDGLPNEGQIDALQEYLDSLKHVGSIVIVDAPSQQTVNLNITVYPNTDEVKDAVESNLANLMLNYWDGDILRNSVVRETISQTLGEQYHTLVQTSDFTASSNSVLVLGTITWG